MWAPICFIEASISGVYLRRPRIEGRGSRSTQSGCRWNREAISSQRVAEGLHGHKHLSRVTYPTLFTDPEQKPSSIPARCSGGDYPRGGTQLSDIDAHLIYF